jgi:hypothetical protein
MTEAPFAEFASFKTGAQVAEVLFSRHIIGWHGSPTQCPVARHLTSQGWLGVQTTYRSVIMYRDNVLYKYYEMPMCVRLFIEEFDNGLYPELLEELENSSWA